jgi:hypothetical protein
VWRNRANDFSETKAVIALVDPPFEGIAAIRVKDVNLAKRLLV